MSQRCPHCNLLVKHRLDSHIRICSQSTPVLHQRMPTHPFRLDTAPLLLRDDMDSFEFTASPLPEEEFEVIMQPPTSPMPTQALPVLDEDELIQLAPTPLASPCFPPHPQNIQFGIPHTATTSPSQIGLLHDAIQQPRLASGNIINLENGTVPTNLIWSSQDLSLLRIYKTCDDAGAPRYLADKLLSLIRSEIHQNGFDPTHHSITRRDPFMAGMHQKFPSTPPTCTDVTMEDGTIIPIFRFDFLSSLRHHLLCQDLYGDIENLNVNPHDRWLPYYNPSGELKELMDGAWFSRTLRKSGFRLDTGQTVRVKLVHSSWGIQD